MGWTKAALAVLVWLAIMLPAATDVRASDEDYLPKSVRVYETVRTGEHITRFFAGSGFFIQGGYVVTAEHVVDGGRSFEVRDGSSGAYIKATVAADDENLDLALLQTPEDTHVYYKLADQLGDGAVTLVGNSETRGESFVEATGDVSQASAWYEIGRDSKHILSAAYRTVITAKSYPGYSGGPVFDENGDIVGVTLAARADNRWAILARLSDLKSFVADNVPSAKRPDAVGLLSHNRFR